MLLRCRATGLPILHIETIDSVMPTCDVVYAPEGCDGRGIINNEKVGARMWMEVAGDTLYDSGPYMSKESGLTIRVRGNTTASSTSKYGNKKPYKLKLQHKADLLFRGNDSVYADKDWVLLRYVICETMAGNMANRALHMPWTPAEEAVLLFLNGDFRGLYLLTENIKRNQNCRINISKTGFLYEFDAYWWNEDFYIPSPLHFKYNYTLKYPESEDILPWQIQYLTESITQTENAYVTPGAIDSVIDVSSYARWLWVHDLLGNRDGGGSNLFITKYDTLPASKTTMACAWDFGGCFNEERIKRWSSQHTFWCFPYFFNLPQSSFVREYVRLYDNVVYDAFDMIADQLDSMRLSAYAEQLDQGKLLDHERWQINEILPTQNLAYMADYLRNRKNDIDSLMTILKAENQWLSIPQIETNGNTGGEMMLFDVTGRRINAPSRGNIILIRYPDGRTQKTIQQ